jgi:hypothetical protein
MPPEDAARFRETAVAALQLLGCRNLDFRRADEAHLEMLEAQQLSAPFSNECWPSRWAPVPGRPPLPPNRHWVQARCRTARLGTRAGLLVETDKSGDLQYTRKPSASCSRLSADGGRDQMLSGAARSEREMTTPTSAERLAEGLAYRDDSFTKHLMHLPSQEFIE